MKLPIKNGLRMFSIIPWSWATANGMGIYKPWCQCFYKAMPLSILHQASWKIITPSMPFIYCLYNKNSELGHSYMKGIMEMNPAAVNKMYPDANFSMRVKYGNVKSYDPRDAIHYDYITASKGILENMFPEIMNLIFRPNRLSYSKRKTLVSMPIKHAKIWLLHLSLPTILPVETAEVL